MKKAVSLLLSCLIPLSITGCVQGSVPDTQTPVTENPSKVVVEMQKEEENGCPRVTGDFIQPWLCEDWSESDWESHYDKLKSAGIGLLILQWVADTPFGSFQFAGYPSDYASSHKTSDYSEKPLMLENALKAAEAKDMKVLVGLNQSNEWWDNQFTSSSWCDVQAKVGNAIAKETYTLYKAKYPHAFYGWYYSWEMYNQNSGYETNWATMMNIQLDYLTQLDSSLPILYSPFISGYITSTPKQLEAQWTSFFEQTHLRAGDIFCPQDSVGASGLSMEYLDGQIAAMKAASLKKSGLKFWVNCENFTKDSQPAPMDRFISQLKMAAKYTDTMITFSYSHYYANHPDYDDAYKAYAGL